VSQKGQFGALSGSGRRRAVSWARPNLRDCPYFGAFSAVWFSSSQVGGARRAGLVAYLGKRRARMTLLAPDVERASRGKVARLAHLRPSGPRRRRRASRPRSPPHRAKRRNDQCQVRDLQERAILPAPKCEAGSIYRTAARFPGDYRSLNPTPFGITVHVVYV
jgi:hypothetical protein